MFFFYVNINVLFIKKGNCCILITSSVIGLKQQVTFNVLISNTVYIKIYSNSPETQNTSGLDIAFHCNCLCCCSFSTTLQTQNME